MALNVARKLIQSHLRHGEMQPGEPIAISIDQTLTQDATGTLVMLTLEALGVERARTEVSVQYVDHNLIQADFRNADDHLFLESAARRFGLWFSRPGNGVSHPLHTTYFARPRRTLLGSDSHTPASGAVGMLAVGAGGLDVAMAIAGEPYHLHMPKVWGVQLVGKLPEWVSAKDVILEMLRRHSVAAARGCVLEFHGPGLTTLSVMDRHVIANMGTELGATATVFPADDKVRRFLAAHGREADFEPLAADAAASYDFEEEIDLSRLEPLVAKPSSPDNVVPVAEISGTPIYQAYIGSSSNPSYRDIAVAAAIVKNRRVPVNVSFDINPTTRYQVSLLARTGWLDALLRAGARLHQTGCNGCIGMGQAPATGRNSLRTVPRNFPGRSGTAEDSVFLCSPETAAASALAGQITDPRTLGMDNPRIVEPSEPFTGREMFAEPAAAAEAAMISVVKGPNIKSLPSFAALPEHAELPILIKVGDNISTDEVMPAGAEVLPYRSNIQRISEFVFRPIEPDYAKRAADVVGSHAILAGANYGQGSSREHAAIAPRFLGVRAILAKSYARIHRANLINYGIVPFEFKDPLDYDRLVAGDKIAITSWRDAVDRSDTVQVECHPVQGVPRRIALKMALTKHDRQILIAGSAINLWRGVAKGRPPPAAIV